jgi:hypothetical protein
MIVLVDLLLVTIIVLLDPAVSLLLTTSAYLFLEFGIMLLLGACFMTRQPLEVEKRFDEKGLPVRAWVWAMRGQNVLVTSLFVLMFAILISGLDMFF